MKTYAQLMEMKKRRAQKEAIVEKPGHIEFLIVDEPVVKDILLEQTDIDNSSVEIIENFDNVSESNVIEANFCNVE